MYEETKEIFREADMNVREFASNDAAFSKLIEKAEHTPVDEISKILGLKWNTMSDELTLSLPKPPETSTTWTKRKALKNVASIYDPLGWISSSTLISKVFVQKLWKTELHWDAVLPNKLLKEWKSILVIWSIQELRLLRKVHLGDSKNLC
ncbi:hypothetical protein NECAME_17307 [Necator americanus]|uniref:Uncharacterized protein n=1 Tax=Necator americanus TaxID=51031 RepID=W2TQN1_NECAM|nr:hypothetical protein NECAME_17307 [Necator americanus]ETN83984.1 hypothetical protein NECAME_17307 [Necator americanus]